MTILILISVVILLFSVAVLCWDWGTGPRVSTRPPNICETRQRRVSSFRSFFVFRIVVAERAPKTLALQPPLTVVSRPIIFHRMNAVNALMVNYFLT
jgi:hypothetical protein